MFLIVAINMPPRGYIRNGPGISSRVACLKDAVCMVFQRHLSMLTASLEHATRTQRNREVIYVSFLTVPTCP